MHEIILPKIYDKPIFQKKLQSLFFPGPAGQLEALTTWPNESRTKIVGIICHPHPQQEGSMHNKVVTTLAKVFDYLGLPTVRFNFRGVGKSEGQYGKTIGETEDLLAVLSWVKSVLPNDTIWLGGFSFGSFIAAKVANEHTIGRLITVATPVNHYDFDSLTNIACPWLNIIGEADEIVPVEQVKTFVAHSTIPIQLIVLPTAGHFFHGHLIELRELLIDHLS